MYFLLYNFYEVRNGFFQSFNFEQRNGIITILFIDKLRQPVQMGIKVHITLLSDCVQSLSITFNKTNTCTIIFQLKNYNYIYNYCILKGQVHNLTTNLNIIYV